MSGNGTLSLDNLIKDPSKVATLLPEAAQLLLIQIASIHSLLVQRALMVTQNKQADDDLLTVPQAAEKLQLSPYRTYELIRLGKLKGTHIGKSVRVKLCDLRTLLSSLDHP